MMTKKCGMALLHSIQRRKVGVRQKVESAEFGRQGGR